MIDGQEGVSVVAFERRPERLNIGGGNLGFHYTVDSSLSDAFRYGLVSRMEEKKRGLNVRKRASRSDPAAVFFTTRINDLYFFGEYNQTLDEKLKDVVGIAISRPDYARRKEEHFGEKDFVEPKKFKALVFVDRRAFEKPSRERRDAYDTYKFGEPLPEDHIKARVESLRRICQQSGVDVPIYGVSGQIY